MAKTKATKEKLPKGAREATPEEKLKWWQEEHEKSRADLLKRAKTKSGVARSQSSLFAAINRDYILRDLAKYQDKTILKQDLLLALTEYTDMDLFESIQFITKWEDLQNRKP